MHEVSECMFSIVRVDISWNDIIPFDDTLLCFSFYSHRRANTCGVAQAIGFSYTCRAHTYGVALARVECEGTCSCDRAVCVASVHALNECDHVIFGVSACVSYDYSCAPCASCVFCGSSMCSNCKCPYSQISPCALMASSLAGAVGCASHCRPKGPSTAWFWTQPPPLTKIVSTKGHLLKWKFSVRNVFLPNWARVRQAAWPPWATTASPIWRPTGPLYLRSEHGTARKKATESSGDQKPVLGHQPCLALGLALRLPEQCSAMEVHHTLLLSSVTFRRVWYDIFLLCLRKYDEKTEKRRLACLSYVGCCRGLPQTCGEVDRRAASGQTPTRAAS